MDYLTFKKMTHLTGADISKEVFLRNQDEIRVKNEKSAITNLTKIFNAVFSISFKKGFQAMSMRDLSDKAGLSLGALYAYFPGKEKLLGIILTQGRSMIRTALEQVAATHDAPADKLAAVIRAHIFLSESMRPWFYFMFMEARNLAPAEFESVKAMEEHTSKILVDILEQGEALGVFRVTDHRLTASMIKAMQQEWYLKRWKYKQQNITVDQYADHVMAWVTAFCLNPDPQEQP